MTQASGIQARNENAAVCVLEEAAILLHHRPAFARADTENQQRRGAPAKGLGNAAALLFIQAAGDQQQATLAQLRLLQQLQGTFDRQGGALPRLGHQRGLERFEQVATGGQIVGQRHQAVGAAGVDDDGGLRIAPRLEQVEQLASGLFQAGRRGIAGQHAWRQLQYHHQWIGGFLIALLRLLPTGADQRQHGERPGQAKQNPGQAAATPAATLKQHGMEGRR